MHQTQRYATILSLCFVVFMCHSSPEEAEEQASKKNGNVETGDTETLILSTDDTGSDSDTEEDHVVWGRQIGTGSNDSLMSVTVDSEDNVWVAGETFGDMDGKNQGAADAVLIKYSPSGKLLATVQFGSEAADTARRVAHDTDDNIIVVGETAGTMGERHIGSKDVFVAKFDRHGERLWTIQYGTDAADTGDCLLIDKDNNILVGGGTFGTLGEAALGNQDGFLSKLTPDGEILWHAQLGTEYQEYTQGIAADSDGNIHVVAGYYQTALSVISKYSPSGQALSQKSLRGLYLMDMHITSDNEVFVSGCSGNQSKFVKLDAELETVWQKAFVSGSWSGEKEIVAVGDGRLATSGCMNWPDCYGFVRVYDFDGNLLASQKIRRSFEPSQSRTTCGAYLAADSTGALYHVGGTEEDLFDDNRGKTDGFLAKISF